MCVYIDIDCTAISIGFYINRCIQIISEPEIHTALSNCRIRTKRYISHCQAMIGTLDNLQFRPQNCIIHGGRHLTDTAANTWYNTSR